MKTMHECCVSEEDSCLDVQDLFLFFSLLCASLRTLCEIEADGIWRVVLAFPCPVETLDCFKAGSRRFCCEIDLCQNQIVVSLPSFL